MPQGITNQLFRKVTVFSQSGPSVAAGVGTDVEFDSAVYRQLFQVIVQFPQGMLVFCILFFAFPVSTENGKQVGVRATVSAERDIVILIYDFRFMIYLLSTINH